MSLIIHERDRGSDAVSLSVGVLVLAANAYYYRDMIVAIVELYAGFPRIYIEGSDVLHVFPGYSATIIPLHSGLNLVTL